MAVTKKTGWITHDSSHIARSQYDLTGHTLDVEFQNGSVYQYHGMTPEEYKDFLYAPSPGEHFHQHIKNDHQYARVK